MARRYARATSSRTRTMTDFAHARKTMVDNQLRTSGDHRPAAADGDGRGAAREVRAGGRGRRWPISTRRSRSARRASSARRRRSRELVQLAAIEHTDRVLDLGCGTGYSAAVLAQARRRRSSPSRTMRRSPPRRARRWPQSASATSRWSRGRSTTAGSRAGAYDVIVVEGALDDVPDGAVRAAQARGPAGGAGRARPARLPVAHLFVKSGKGIASRADVRCAAAAARAGRATTSFVF